MDEAIAKEVKEHLSKHEGAVEFIAGYGMLVHAVDDLIDRDNPEIKDYKIHVLDCYNLSMDVFSSAFYQRNWMWLYPIVKNIHRVYSDSVTWEHSDVNWKRQYADSIRCCGHEVLMAVLEHLCRLDYAELRRISLALREWSWHQHHDAEGKPI
jgi:hypothetical protein